MDLTKKEIEAKVNISLAQILNINLAIHVLAPSILLDRLCIQVMGRCPRLHHPEVVIERINQILKTKILDILGTTITLHLLLTCIIKDTKEVTTNKNLHRKKKVDLSIFFSSI